jgi:integrase
MSRPRHDGTPARAKRKRALTELYLQKTKLEPGLHWDATQRGLALSLQPSGRRAWKLIYSIHNRVRWFHLGDAHAMTLGEARKLAAEKRVEVDKGKDPQGEKRARLSTNFAQLAQRHLEEHAKPRNRSWRQADALVQRHLIPVLGKLPAGMVSREDIASVLAKIKSPTVANQTLAAASAIFSWALNRKAGGVLVHPCKGVGRFETNSRERVLSASELPRFWTAFEKIVGPAGAALQIILLTGQRPGEVSHLRAEHIDSGWWTLPGQPDPALGWPGTKNGESHRVWLSAPVRRLLEGLPRTGFLLAGGKDRPALRLPDVMRAICNDLGISNRVTPHDLRRTFGTTVAALGYGRSAVDRLLNHADNSITAIYDRWGYADEDRRISEAVASHLVGLATGENR